MAPTAQQVKQTLGALLQTLDLNTATERTIRSMVAERLGVPVDEHKKLIKDEIDAFLTHLATQEADDVAAEEPHDDATDDDSDFEVDDDVSTARGTGKRKAPAAKASKRPAKQAKQSKGAAAGAGLQGVSWHLGSKGQKYARVEEFRGVTRVDLRECYNGNGGELLPGGKGIALQPQEWAVLAGAMEQLQEAARGGDHDYMLQLSELRRAYVGEFKGSVLVHVREFYTTPDGAPQPGKKGIALTLEQLESLAQVIPDITAALPADAEEAGGAAAAAGAGAGAAAAGKAGAAKAAGKKAGKAGVGAEDAAAGRSSAAAGTAASTAASKQEQQQGEQGAKDWVDLGASKRGSISEFKGKHYVDLREWYLNKNTNAWAPGQKGISLPPEEWQLLCDGAELISKAVLAEDEGTKVDLRGQQRRAYVNVFKGKPLVHIREMYEKGGQMLPGKKGVALTPDAWNTLVAAMPRLTQQLEAASS